MAAPNSAHSADACGWTLPSQELHHLTSLARALHKDIWPRCCICSRICPSHSWAAVEHILVTSSGGLTLSVLPCLGCSYQHLLLTSPFSTVNLWREISSRNPSSGWVPPSSALPQYHVFQSCCLDSGASTKQDLPLASSLLSAPGPGTKPGL